MNAGFDLHFSAEVWEEFALGRQSEEDCRPLEEHLLICAACQDLLAATDEYIRVAKAATALSASTAKRWSKPVATAATVA